MACNEEWVKLLRREVEEVTGRLGWTKEAVDEFHMVDSLAKESQRLHPVAMGTFILHINLSFHSHSFPVMSRRLALTPWSFPNGCTVPANTSLCVYIPTSTYNEEMYKDPETFDPL